VQTEDAPALSDVGLQATVLIVTAEGTVILPLVALIDTAGPLADAPVGLVTLIGIVPAAVPESVTFTVASVPFWIVLVFSPLTRQVAEPLPAAQVSVLDAAVVAAPADTLRLAILDVLYVRVH
jgi:hypothetical protein